MKDSEDGSIAARDERRLPRQSVAADLEDRTASRKRADLRRAPAWARTGLHRRCARRADHHPHGRWRPHNLLPGPVRIPVHVRRDPLDHPVRQHQRHPAPALGTAHLPTRNEVRMTDTPRNQRQEGELITGQEEPAVRVVDVTMDFAGGGRALEDVSFGLPKGELTSIIGPSGCGKTTTLKIIAGLIQPTSGEVLVNGSPVRGPGPDRAMVFQDFALMPWATVLRNAAFGLELRGVPRKER